MTRTRYVLAGVLGAVVGGGGVARGQCPGWTTNFELGPIARSLHAAAFDVPRARMIMYGGFDPRNFVVLGDTWAYATPSWMQLSPATTPGERQGHAMTYDSARQRVVLFGGGPGTLLNDVWEWNGSNWMRTHDGSGTAPPARTRARLAYDSVRGVSVLFGGRNAASVALGDTWEYNGAAAAWAERFPAVSPAARDEHAMAYDAARQRVVLFGGETTPGTINGDTWEWNGTSWLPLGTGGPDPRLEAAMAYDSGRQRLVLFGGAGSVFLTDTWERVGTAWSQVATTNNPSGRRGASMVYDPGRARMVLFGGVGVNGALLDVWEYVCAAACYANCDGSTGTQPLNVNDFVCFQTRFAAADPYADCDQSGSLNVNDFVCFQTRFAAGCR